MTSFNRRSLQFVFSFVLFVIAHSVKAHNGTAFHISQLTATTDHRLFPYSVHNLPDATVIITISSTYSINELQLHPSVIIPTTTYSGETFLVLRMRAKSGRVIWARALSGFQNAIASDIDSSPTYDVYISLKYGFQSFPDSRGIIKLSSKDGSVVYEKRFPDTVSNDDECAVPFESIKWTAPGNLVLAGQSPPNSAVCIAVLDPSTGSVKYSHIVRTPVALLNVNAYALDATSKVACVTINGDAPVQNNVVYVTCFNHQSSDPKLRFVKLDPGLGNRVTKLGRFVTLALQKRPSKNKCPKVYIAYEREIKQKHTLVVRTLCVWRIGKKSNRMRDVLPLTEVDLATPKFGGEAMQTNGMKYISSSKGLALMLSMQNGGGELTRDSKGKITKLVGTDGFYEHPGKTWMLFLNSNAEAVELLPVQVGQAGFQIPTPFTYVIFGDFDVGRGRKKGKFVTVMGMLNNRANGVSLSTGGFVTYDVPVPTMW